MIARGLHLILLPLLIPALAHADDQLVLGSALSASASSSRQSLRFTAKGTFTRPVPGSADDPATGGATLQLLNPGTGESATFSLPGVHWSATRSGSFKYHDTALAEPGKVRVALIGRTLRISAKSVGITLDEPQQGALAVVLVTGSLRYCALFDDGSVRRDVPGRFSARRAPAPAACPGGSTGTTISSTSTTTTTSTTVVTIPGCDCCSASRLTFTSGLPQIGLGGCGTVKNGGGATLLNLDCGGLYFGGGNVTVPLPAAVPDLASSVLAITTCSSVTGAFVLGSTTAADTGSNRNCTDSSVVNPEYPGKPGCLFGPPLPIPNPTTPGLSVCVVNRVKSDASGSGNCNNGSVTVDLPLLSDLYLTGDLLDGSAADRPNVPGIQPCPICTGSPGSETCKGGANNGLGCTPGDSASLGQAYPTSHDCPPPGGVFGSLDIPFLLGTGQSTKTSVDQPSQSFVFCGFCSRPGVGPQGPPPVPCTSSSQCTTFPYTACVQGNSGAFGADTARTVTEIGSPAGMCVDDGAVHATILGGVFCLPPSYNTAVDVSADLPGPGAVSLTGGTQLQ